MQFKDVVTDPIRFRELMGDPPAMRGEDHRNDGPALPRLHRQVAICSDCLSERPGTDGYFP